MSGGISPPITIVGFSFREFAQCVPVSADDLFSRFHLQFYQRFPRTHSRGSERWLFARTVPNVQYLHGLRGLGNIIKDSVGTEDNHAQGTSCAAWICGANEGEGAKGAGVIENAAPQSVRRLWIVARDVRANILEVCNCRVGPDYLEVHAVAHDSTSCSTS